MCHVAMLNGFHFQLLTDREAAQKLVAFKVDNGMINIVQRFRVQHVKKSINNKSVQRMLDSLKFNFVTNETSPTQELSR